MRLADWVRSLPDTSELKSLLKFAPGVHAWESITSEARPVCIAASFLAQPRPLLVVTGSYERALHWQAKLQLCGVAPDAICQLPSGSSALFEDASPEHIALSDRLGTLRRMAQGETCIVIASPSSALERTLPKDVLNDAFFELKVGQSIQMSDLLDKLGNLGYEMADPVRIPGQFSRRGGILDIFASGHDFPVRIEFFGDDIESLRLFDANTQRSIGPIKTLALSPSRETVYVSNSKYLRDMVMQALLTESAGLDEESSNRLEELISSDARAIEEHLYFDRLDLYRPLIFPDSGCALDLLEASGQVVLDEPLELEINADRTEEELGQALKARAERGEILATAASDFTFSADHLWSHDNTLCLTSMNALPKSLECTKTTDLDMVSLESYRGRADALAQTLKNYADSNFTVLFSTDQPNRAKTVLNQVELYPATPEPSQEVSTGLHLLTGNLAGGFVSSSRKFALVTDAELFGVGRLKLPQRKFMEGVPVATVLDLKPGDYVVHINFGIGIFRGLAKREVEGVEKEFLYIEYAPPDKLYVPADQLDRVQKYLNPGDENPKLNRLTGGEWQRTLGKAKEDAREFARELIKLYADRKRVQRKAYPPDTPWQDEMESTFPWVETPSQMQAIKDAKRDLQLPYPMDRLVCGDVGFGKTEVAIRAAFKVVQSARQVAVLCPTTILSEQHARNFHERLSSFGVRIAVMNRFVTTAEKKEIFRDIEGGKIDIVIGTHALLASEIHFKDLGMVVIDEEQKFGVKQKEALKKLRTEVDVLTMSATPIPRTLSMALMDIRQMSLINDPPPGRLPIRTFVRPHSDEVIREAILREMARGGQAFYVYNRVESINHVAEKLRKLVPMARIGVGHGQMHEKELEPIMVGFVKGEIDVLLSTTIVENGIDISNANTLIVHNSDRLGLSQLYQLRGRVGRSDRQAYAYFLYQNNKELNDSAQQRLQALQEFSSLGAGYSLAFRDLQIRGAGELLGSKQHGAMAAVGYELYTQLINEQVQLLKSTADRPEGSRVKETLRDPLAMLTPLPAYELPAIAFLPDSYIRDEAQRLYFYQQMMSSRSLDQLQEVKKEVLDRYGNAPEPVVNAFAVMAARLRGRDLGVDKIDGRGGRLAISFADRQSVSPRVWSIIGKAQRDSYLNRDGLIWPYTGNPIHAVERMLETFDKACKQVEAERATFA